MRIYGNLERGLANLGSGRERARLARVAFRGAPVRPPLPGAVLKRIHVEDCVRGAGYTLEIRQGRRRNGIEVWRYGRRIVARHGGGFDALFREIRRDWALRWLVLN